MPRPRLHARHPFAERVQLVLAEHRARGAEHLAFFLVDVVLDGLLQHLELGAPLLLVGGHVAEFLHDDVGHVVLLEALQHDVPGLGVRPKRRVEDLLLDHLVRRQFRRNRVEQRPPSLHPARRRLLAALEQVLHAPVIGLQEDYRVRGPAPRDRPLHRRNRPSHRAADDSRHRAEPRALPGRRLCPVPRPRSARRSAGRRLLRSSLAGLPLGPTAPGRSAPGRGTLRRAVAASGGVGSRSFRRRPSLAGPLGRFRGLGRRPIPPRPICHEHLHVRSHTRPVPWRTTGRG